ncbi:hypothetical protein BGZ95_004498, partial [Linnemannia exigua]
MVCYPLANRLTCYAKKLDTGTKCNRHIKGLVNILKVIELYSPSNLSNDSVEVTNEVAPFAGPAGILPIQQEYDSDSSILDGATLATSALKTINDNWLFSDQSSDESESSEVEWSDTEEKEQADRFVLAYKDKTAEDNKPGTSDAEQAGFINNISKKRADKMTNELLMESLKTEPNIIQSAEALGLAPEDVFKLSDSRVDFVLTSTYYPKWLDAHKRLLGNTFYNVGGRKYTVAHKSGWESKHFHCSHWGKPRVHRWRLLGGDSGRRRKVRKKSIKSGCRGKFTTLEKTATLASGRIDKVMVVRYHHQHNHFLEIDKQEYRQRTLQHQVLRQGADKAQGLRPLRQNTLCSEDLYNIYYQDFLRKAVKDKDPLVSATMWMRSFARKGDFAWSDENEDKFFCFATRWQLEQLGRHGDVVCIDGTHEMFGARTFLFTLVVRNKDHGYGIPVAFCLTRNPTSQVLKPWIFKLVEFMELQMGIIAYTPKVVLLDQGHAEFATIVEAFPTAKVFYCYFHVIKAVTALIHKTMNRDRDNMVMKVDGEMVRVDKFKDIETEAVHQFQRIIVERDMTTATALITAFKVNWINNSLLQHVARYFEEEMRPRWMFAYRQDISYGATNTNNLIESFHNTLRHRFFKGTRHKFADRVIYTLAEKVIPYFMDKVTVCSGSVGRMSNLSRLMVKAEQLAQVYVKLHPIDAAKGTVSRCSCRDGFQLRIQCHHVALVLMELKWLKFDAEAYMVSTPGFIPSVEPTNDLSPLPSAKDPSDAQYFSITRDLAWKVQLLKSKIPKNLALSSSRAHGINKLMDQAIKVAEHGHGILPSRQKDHSKNQNIRHRVVKLNNKNNKTGPVESPGVIYTNNDNIEVSRTSSIKITTETSTVTETIGTGSANIIRSQTRENEESATTAMDKGTPGSYSSTSGSTGNRFTRSGKVSGVPSSSGKETGFPGSISTTNRTRTRVTRASNAVEAPGGCNTDTGSSGCISATDRTRTRVTRASNDVEAPGGCNTDTGSSECISATDRTRSRVTRASNDVEAPGGCNTDTGSSG